MRRSAVSLAHPVHVTTVAAYDVKSRDLIAGVVCIPWLDSAVPAGVLRPIEDLGGDIMLQAHPGQLSGALTSGRFACCFDWGTRWPWRWSAEVAIKVAMGFWSSMPLSVGLLPRLFEAIGNLAMLAIKFAFAYGVFTIGPYDHRNDNTALGATSLAAFLVVLLRCLGGGLLDLAFTLSCVAGMLAFVPCFLALLAAVGLAVATLSRLEAQGLHDRFLPHPIGGWGKDVGLDNIHSADVGAGAGPRTRSANNSTSGVDGYDTAPDSADTLDGRAVEVILPGERKAFAIVLPAVTRLRVVQMQLLPPVAGRGGDPESLPPCMATGERARLPLPLGLLFPASVKLHPTIAATSSRSMGRGVETSARVPPLAAIMASGHTGRLIYADEAYNEGGADWRVALRSFFGFEGSLLADEAERLVEHHAAPESFAGACEPVLVVIEVLPAWAAEFMDERHDPQGGV